MRRSKAAKSVYGLTTGQQPRTKLVGFKSVPIFWKELIDPKVVIGQSNLVTVGVYKASVDTPVLSVYGSVAQAFTVPSTTGKSFGQLLLQLRIAEKDPGDGPFNNWPEAFAAMGASTHLAVFNAKLATDKDQVKSETTPVSFLLPPKEVPAGMFLVMVCGRTHNAHGNNYGKYNWELQLVVGTTEEMVRIR